MRGSSFIVRIVVLCLGLAYSQSMFAADDGIRPEKVVAEHIKAIGSPRILAAIKSRSFVGTSTVEFIQGMRGILGGQSMLIAEGPRLGIVMKFANKDYPGEYFAYDGKSVTVQHMNPGVKSPLAEFLFRYNGLMKEGLLGGVMTGSWPLLKLEEKGARISYAESSVEGKKAHMLEYRPKTGLGDVKIKLYFDWETYRHIMTEYNVRHREDASAQSESNYTTERYILDTEVPDSFYRLVERFGDFQKTGGLTLPHSYQIEYSVEGVGETFLGKWDIKAAKWGFNSTFDDKLFKAEK